MSVQQRANRPTYKLIKQAESKTDKNIQNRQILTKKRQKTGINRQKKDKNRHKQTKTDKNGHKKQKQTNTYTQTIRIAFL